MDQLYDQVNSTTIVTSGERVVVDTAVATGEATSTRSTVDSDAGVKIKLKRLEAEEDQKAPIAN